jgi:hypothetical protein
MSEICRHKREIPSNGRDKKTQQNAIPKNVAHLIHSFISFTAVRSSIGIALKAAFVVIVVTLFSDIRNRRVQAESQSLWPKSVQVTVALFLRGFHTSMWNMRVLHQCLRCLRAIALDLQQSKRRRMSFVIMCGGMCGARSAAASHRQKAPSNGRMLRLDRHST